MSFNKIGIISDDFTGANDSGIQLVKKGMNASVVLNFTEESCIHKRDVLIVDTDSRALKTEDAKEAVKNVALLFKDLGYTQVYKKIDSTLRGNLGAELVAVEEVYQPDLIVIAPAFPKMDRITHNGYHYVNGVLIAETEYGKDPKTPVRYSYLPELFMKQVGKKVEVFTQELLLGPEATFFQRVESCLAEKISWIVCDVVHDVDFKNILQRFKQTKKKIVWAGSAGLIEYVPECLLLDNSQEFHQREKPLIHRTLTISGSLSKTTRVQLEEASQLENAFSLKLTIQELLHPSFSSASILNHISNFPLKNHLLVYVESSEENRISATQEGQKYGLSNVEISHRIVERLGQIAKDICASDKTIQGLFLTGGDTAKAVCSKMGITEMELLTEVSAGLPFGKLIGNEQELWAVTKAGGFGHQQSIKEALKFLTGSES